ncbi:hypothetical protein D6C81_02636 [Aureobasidium pullulans]|nr:hypothetical protein D6C81_02636 [Aureobasidium pullulans]
MSARGPWFETQGRFFWILLHFLPMVTRHKHLDIHPHIHMISGIQRKDLSRHEAFENGDDSRAPHLFDKSALISIWLDGDQTARTVLRRRLLNP